MTDTARPTLVWFRRDLRLDDNPALRAAARRGGPLIPVYIHAPEEDGAWMPGAASRWWLHQSLTRLGEGLVDRGLRLVVRRGESLATLRALVRETNAGAVCWNDLPEPEAAARDARIKMALTADGLAIETGNAALLFQPDEIRKRDGGPFQVFTPFWNACLARPAPERPKPAPRTIKGPGVWPTSPAISELALEPEVDWAGGFRAAWRPGESGARNQLRRFVGRALADYDDGRNRPDLPGSSRLSPYLHFGELSPRRVWWTVRDRVERSGNVGHDADVFLAEIGWREFAHHLLTHFPTTTEKPLRAEFAAFPWANDRKLLAAWAAGRTGYPVVDAGMRELWSSGWMHNRVRMIAGSFLVKDLLVPWQEGARWFWDTLVDADLANNTLGWQWIAGCGADAAPYFRIFNPVLQGQRFDPDGAYVRRWVPELEQLPARWIHRPWEAPVEVLAEAGVVLGTDYPRPIVDHALARDRALIAYGKIRKSAAVKRGSKGTAA